MEETTSGNDIITDTLIEETPPEVLPNENAETIPEVTPEINDTDIQNNPTDITSETQTEPPIVEDGENVFEELNGVDTVSGSDVRTDTTTEYIDYTDLLTSIDARLEVIETTYTEQTENIMAKPFENYTVSESIGLAISVIAICVILYQLLFGK